MPVLADDTDRKQHGSSTSACEWVVRRQLEVIKPTTLVDFGAGGGKQGNLARSVLGTSCRLIAVEGYLPSVEHLRTHGPYDEVHHALLQDWIGAATGHYDVALFGDVLEHVPPRTIRRVMERCQTLFDHILINIPLHDLYQDDSYGNALEIHRAFITEHFFDRYHPVERHLVQAGRYTIMNVRISKGGRAPGVPARLLNAYLRATQPIGLARPTVDLLKRYGRRFKGLVRD
jgi:hypothetical protein